MDVLYKVEVVYLTLLISSCATFPDPNAVTLLIWASRLGVAVCTVEYSTIVLVDKKVVFCEAGQFLISEGQAVTVYTSVMYRVRVLGPLDEGLGVITKMSRVLGDAIEVGTAMTTGALLVIGESWAELKRVVFWKMGDDEGKVEWTTLIAVLRAGTAIVEEANAKVLVWFANNVLMTVVLLDDGADEVAVEAAVLLALTGIGITVDIVALRDV
jgi:hypothetical protein